MTEKERIHHFVSNSFDTAQRPRSAADLPELQRCCSTGENQTAKIIRELKQSLSDLCQNGLNKKATAMQKCHAGRDVCCH